MRFVQLFILIMFFAMPVFANGIGAERSQSAEPLLDKTNRSGSFSHSVEFEVPSYRGLVPKLGLVYNSSNSGFGRSEVNLGPGWQLSGFSSIERVSIGGGAPKYEDNRDVFLIDGQPLLACADVDATNPLSALQPQYPAGYLTDQPSASCGAGGNLVTIVENHRKIELKRRTYDGRQIDYFVVTMPNGRRYQYESIGYLSQATIADDEVFKALFQRKFLVSEIKDTQAVNDNPASSGHNTVLIDYLIDVLENGGAHRPLSVRYGGPDTSGSLNYEVRFHYYKPDVSSSVVVPNSTPPFAPLTSFATGTEHPGRQFWLLSGVTVYDGSTNVRAYSMSYNVSSEIQRPLLSKVSQSGSGFQITELGSLASVVVIDANNNLPPLLSEIGYSEQQTQTEEIVFSGNSFAAFDSVGDYDADGVAELVLYDMVSWDSNTDSSGQLQTTNKSFFQVQRNVSGASLLPTSIFDSVEILTGDHTIQTIATFLPAIDQSGDSIIANYFSGYYVTKKLGNSCSGGDGCNTPTTYELHSNTQTMRDGLSATLSVSTGSQSVSSFAQGAVLSSDLAPASLGSHIAHGYAEVLTVKKQNGSQPTSRQITSFPGTRPIWDETGHHPSASDTILNSSNGHSDVLGYADIDGDGLLEEVIKVDDNLAINEFDAGDGPTLVTSRAVLDNTRHVMGDFDGDGKVDLAEVGSVSGNPSIWVKRATGNGFLVEDEWATTASGRVNLLGQPNQSTALGALFSNANLFAEGRLVALDINTDGLTDLVFLGKRTVGLVREVCSGRDRDGCHSWRNSTTGGTVDDGFVLISNGNGFVEAGTPNSVSGQIFDSLVNVADVDGNNRPDFVLGGSNGRIVFNDGAKPNLLTTFKTENGATTSVEYTTDAASTVNSYPYVPTNVTQISIDGGRGQTRTAQISYNGGEYDYRMRRALGYRNVTVELAPLTNHSDPTFVDTVYATDHYAMKGRVVSQTTRESSHTTYRQVLNDYNTALDGNGPFRVVKSSSVERQRFGSELISTQRKYAWDLYGNAVSTTNLGLVQYNNDGTYTDIDPSDSTILVRDFGLPNLSRYIVDRPVSETLFQLGNEGSGLAQDWLSAAQFFYDQDITQPISNALPPTHGNLTRLLALQGDGSAIAWRDAERNQYDVYGNLTLTKNAKGYDTSYVYDASRPEFLTSTTNALGHISSMQWNTACQAPSTETDANGRVVAFQYDSACRPQSTVSPAGAITDFAYDMFGDVANQNIREVSEVHEGAAATLQTMESRDYFDGFGDVYLSSQASTLPQPISVLYEYDERGNLSWYSRPRARNLLIGVTGRGGESGTEHFYDPIGRKTQSIAVNGATTTFLYETTSVSVAGATTNYPTVVTRSPECNDGDASTQCIETKLVSDGAGRTIQKIMVDPNLTDVGSVSPERATHYIWDNVGNLISVTDPGGAVWTYTYDREGNRLSADDPGLGYWTMTYDANRLLDEQVDAAGNRIAFTYDALDRVTQKRVTWNDGTFQQIDDTNYDYDIDNAGTDGTFNTGQLTRVANGVHEVLYGYGDTGGIETELHVVDGITYRFENDYHRNGTLERSSYPQNAAGLSPLVLRTYHDEYNGFWSIGPLGAASPEQQWIASTKYSDWRDQVREMRFGDHTDLFRTTDGQMGWVNRTYVTDLSTGNQLSDTTLTRATSGRIVRQFSNEVASQFDYCYDTQGRMALVRPVSSQSAPALDCSNFQSYANDTDNVQYLTYKPDGSIASNSLFTNPTYDYTGSPVAHAPANVNGQPLNYDANGNMTTGIDGKVMTYDGENRPLSVTQQNGTITRYVYGADGKRLKKIENADTPMEKETLYLGQLEVQGNDFIVYPHPNVRAINGVPNYIVADVRGSNRLILDENGDPIEGTTYMPFGEPNVTPMGLPSNSAVEGKRFLGERYDPDAELSYLNARYYDPKLGMFIQPDWWEVTNDLVGTNRFAYSLNDPVGLVDPNGNAPDYGYGTLGSYQRGTPYDDDHGGYQPSHRSRDYATALEAAHRASSGQYGSFDAEQTRDIIMRSIENSRLASGGLESGDAVFEVLALGAGVVRLGGNLVYATIKHGTKGGKYAINLSSAGLSAAERASLIEYAKRSNTVLAKMGVQTVTPTKGLLRSQANSAKRVEQARARRAGTPYRGQTGHVPDTAVTGLADPPGGWLDMVGRSNQRAGAPLGSRIGSRIDHFTVDGVRP